MDNNALLEDEALLCCLRQDQQSSDKNESTDESISDEMDIYNGVSDIKHSKRSVPSCSSDDDDVNMDFFCDHS